VIGKVSVGGNFEFELVQRAMVHVRIQQIGLSESG